MHSISMPMMHEAQNAYFLPQDTIRMASAANSTLPCTPAKVRWPITQAWIR